MGKIIVRSLDEMLTVGRLKYGDEVHFKDLIYSVRQDYLGPSVGGHDIFYKHGLDKYNFCRFAYGYLPVKVHKTSSVWPSCRYGDFIALSNCVTMLYVLENKGKINEKLLDCYIAQSVQESESYIAHSIQESEARILNLMELIDGVKTASGFGVK